MDYVIEEYDICRTCGWEYDPVQNVNPDRKSGANKDSLVEHREWFLKIRQKNKRFKWHDAVESPDRSYTTSE